MTMLALVPSSPSGNALTLCPVTPRVGTPRRAAILTALAMAAVRTDNLKGVLTLARTGRPRALRTVTGGKFRWLALAGLTTAYPEANAQALAEALGCRLNVQERSRNRVRRGVWHEEDVQAVARAVVEQEDAALTGRWIWPHACAVAAAHTGADAAVVATVTGSRSTPPRVVARARKLAVYLTMTEGDVNLTAMAAATGLDKSTVRFHVDGLGDARDDDAELDATLEALAAQLRERLDGELSQW